MDASADSTNRQHDINNDVRAALLTQLEHLLQ
ncbi:unnamed protein product, partial [Rotaria sordida]